MWKDDRRNICAQSLLELWIGLRSRSLLGVAGASGGDGGGGGGGGGLTNGDAHTVVGRTVGRTRGRRAQSNRPPLLG